MCVSNQKALPSSFREEFKTSNAVKSKHRSVPKVRILSDSHGRGVASLLMECGAKTWM